MKTSEHIEQSKVVAYCRAKKIPVFAIPNGIFLKDKAVGYKIMAKMKREGLSKGVPDLFIPVQNRTSAGLFIEMKTKGGRVSKEQKEWGYLLNANGYTARVCWSANEAIELIESHIKE